MSLVLATHVVKMRLVHFLIFVTSAMLTYLFRYASTICYYLREFIVVYKRVHSIDVITAQIFFYWTIFSPLRFLFNKIFFIYHFLNARKNFVIQRGKYSTAFQCDAFHLWNILLYCSEAIHWYSNIQLWETEVGGGGEEEVQRG